MDLHKTDVDLIEPFHHLRRRLSRLELRHGQASEEGRRRVPIKRT